MTSEQIKSYREKIDTQTKEKIYEFDKNLGIAALGSLGFFLTINEKFIGLFEANYKALLIISIIAFFITIGILLFHAFMTAHEDLKIITTLDDFPNGTTIEEDSEIYSQWKKANYKLSFWRIASIVLFLIGIITELIFFVLNTSNYKKEEKNNEIKVYVSHVFDSTSNPVKKDTSYKIDSIK